MPLVFKSVVLEPIPAVIGRKAGHTLDRLPVFRLWEETDADTGRNMQTPHREDLGRPAGNSNPGPSCYEATALPTTPLCHPRSNNRLNQKCHGLYFLVDNLCI
ncbi:hypothetical protein AOLI_G00222840 [Acnodon oligacanthus]